MRPYFNHPTKVPLPRLTFVLIGATALVFVIEISLPPALRDSMIRTLALTPDALKNALAAPLAAPLGVWLSLFTHPLLHTGWFHFLWNTVALLAAGPAVEARFQGRGVAGLYLGGAVTGALAHTWSSADMSLPLLGAAGAVAGILGAYLSLHLRTRLIIRLPLVPGVRLLPVWLLVAAWAAVQWLASPGFGNVLAARAAAGGSVWLLAAGLAWGGLATRLAVRMADRPAAQPRPAPRHYNPYDNPEEEYRPYPERSRPAEDEDK